LGGEESTRRPLEKDGEKQRDIYERSRASSAVRENMPALLGRLGKALKEGWGSKRASWGGRNERRVEGKEG